MSKKNLSYKSKNFTVSVFGTGSEITNEDKKSIKNARKLGNLLIKNGYKLATGGYKGVMGAVSEGAANKAEELGIEPSKLITGYVFDSRKFKENEVRKAKLIRVESLTSRLANLISKDAFVVFSGKFGTIIELFVAIESERVRKEYMGYKIRRPIIIFGGSKKIMSLLGLVSKGEKKFDFVMNHIYVLPDGEKCLKLCNDIISIYTKAKKRQLEVYSSGFSKYTLGKYLKN